MCGHSYIIQYMNDSLCQWPCMVVVSAERIRPTQNLHEIASLLDHKITQMTFIGLGWISIKHQFRNLYCRHEKQETILSSQCTFIYVFDQYMNTLNDQYDESYISSHKCHFATRFSASMGISVPYIPTSAVLIDVIRIIWIVAVEYILQIYIKLDLGTVNCCFK